MQSVLRIILARAEMWPDRPAIFLHDNALTYDLLRAGICSAEVELARLGLDREAPVGVFIQSPIDHLVVCLALSKAGYTSASLRSDTIGKCHEAGIAVIICDKRLTEADLGSPNVRPIRIAPGWYQNDFDPSIGRIYAPPADRVVRIEFTSGSTGTPKPIAYTDSAIYHQTVNRIATYDLRGQVALCMFRVTVNVGFGFALGWLMLGRTLCFIENFAQAVDMMNFYRVEDVVGSPRQVGRLATDFAQSGRTIRIPGKIVIGGGQVSREDYRRIKQQFSGEVQIDYGATETGPTGVVAGRLMEAGGDALGVLVPFQTIDVGAPVGQRGLIRTRATGMGTPFSGSLTQIAADFGDGWFHTGDIGVVNERGQIELVGRADDMVNVGGLKVSLDQIEQTLASIPDVREAAAVVSAKDGDSGLLLGVVAADGADRDAITHTVSEVLRGVSGMQLHFVAAIAKTDSGKVDRQLLLRQLGAGA